MNPFDPTAVTGTPFGAPLVPPLPIRLRRTEILTIVHRTDPEAADRLIPAPLELAGDLCVVHVYRMHDAEWFGVYCESAWQLPVRMPDGTTAVYSPFLVLESDGAVAAGREAYGQPKKARPGVARAQRRPAGRPRCPKRHRDRHGDHVLEADARRAAASWSGWSRGRASTSTCGCARRRATPSAASWSRATSRTWSSTRPGPGPGTLELRANAQAPVHLLPVREVVLALHRVVDLTLAPGRVVHRY